MIFEKGGSFMEYKKIGKKLYEGPPAKEKLDMEKPFKPQLKIVRPILWLISYLGKWVHKGKTKKMPRKIRGISLSKNSFCFCIRRKERQNERTVRGSFLQKTPPLFQTVHRTV